MPFFQHDGIQFHYGDSGSGTPFVFQHGLGADVSQTFSLFRPPPGIRLITLECRGHGQTAPLGPEDRIAIPQFAEDVCALMDHLHLQRVVIGGISMGAATALHLVLTHPERAQAFVLSRPAWLETARQSGLEVFGAIAALIRKYGALEGSRRFQEAEAFQRIQQASPDNAQSLLTQFSHPRAEETVAKLERIPRHVPAFTRADWQRIQIPTLVLGNRIDSIHPFEFAEAYAQAIPGAVLRELTPKSVDKDRHTADTQRYLEEFLAPFASETTS